MIGPGIGAFRATALLGLACMLCACGGTGSGKVQSASAATPRVAAAPSELRRPMRYRPRNPQVQAIPGLEGVIGLTAGRLSRMFGPARLDVWEGDARKLQFSGNACVLDIYLYPDAPGGEPEAAYIDARRPEDGKDVDRAGCVEALKASR